MRCVMQRVLCARRTFTQIQTSKSNNTTYDMVTQFGEPPTSGRARIGEIIHYMKINYKMIYTIRIPCTPL